MTDQTSRDFDAELAGLGFAAPTDGRRGDVVHTLAFNRHLTFHVHDDGEHALVTWAFGLGEYLEERGWRLSVTDTSTAEVYPRVDVRVPRTGDAVRGEITRVLGSLRLDLGDPAL